MMYLSFSDEQYMGSSIEILPENRAEIPGLRDVLMNSFVIENPLYTYARNMNTGVYADEDEEQVYEYRELARELSAVWNNQDDMNVMMALSRALQMIVDLKRNTMDDPDDIPEMEGMSEDEWERANEDMEAQGLDLTWEDCPADPFEDGDPDRDDGDDGDDGDDEDDN